MRSRTRRPPGALFPALMMLALACGGERGTPAPPAAAGRAAGPAGARATLGTIRATVDGQDRTWYVVSGTVAGRPQETGGWIETGAGSRGVALAGFELEQVPLGSFEWSDQGMLRGYGEYTGSLLTVMLFLDGEPSSLTVRFPPAPGQAHAIGFSPRADATDLSAIHFLAEGLLEIGGLRYSSGEVELEGTFSGTFRTMDGRSSFRISDGRFQAAGLRRLGPAAER